MRRDNLARRLFAAAVLMFAVLVATPGMSSAALPYPAPPGQGSVSSGTVTAGGTVTFSGSGFLPGETIIIGIGYANSGGQLDETVASALGAFSLEVRPPLAGDATLFATGVTSDFRVTAAIRVLPVAAPDNGGTNGDVNGTDGADANGTDGANLPVTGTGPAKPIAFGGAALLALGAVLVGFTATRRRRTAEI
jgi:hypothetical protein